MIRVQLTASVSEKVYEEIQALRKKLILHINNNVSRAAVVRLLLYLGLKAARDMDIEALLEIARREGLL